jgi:hypothetical protein
MAIDRVRVNEGSTTVIEFNVLDADGAAVPAASLTLATLTLYDIGTYVPGSPVVGILNSRDQQDVNNDHDVTISDSTTKLVTWTSQPDDHVIVTPRRQLERHRAQFHFEWATGEFNYELEIEVVNLRSQT